MVHTALNFSHHDVSHEHSGQVEWVAIPHVETIDEQGHQVLQTAASEVVERITCLALRLEDAFFLVDVLDLVEELVLPAVQLDSLDVLEGLVDVEHALVSLFSHLLREVLLSRLTHIADSKLHQCEKDNDEAIPSDVHEAEVAG